MLSRSAIGMQGAAQLAVTLLLISPNVPIDWRNPAARMHAFAASINSDPPTDEVLSKSRERRALSVACGAHALHGGYTDLIWVALPIWQAEFALSYAAVGLLRMIYSGTMASLQIPAARIAERLGAGAVLALGTAICG